MPALDPVDAAALAARLPLGPLDRVEVVAETGSTNVDLAAAARAGEPGGAVLIAEHQTAGRGRFTRSWIDTPGANISVSVMLRSVAPVARWPWLALVAGLGARDGLAALTGLPVALKWPNDVLLEPGPGVRAPGKLVGVIAERVETPVGPAAVLGIGINIGTAREELPVETATSLWLNDARVSKTDVAAALLAGLGGWLTRWEAGEDLRPAYAERCATIGRRVRVQIDAELGRGETIEGTAVDVDGFGSLVVETAGGRVDVAAGDCLHLRPA